MLEYNPTENIMYCYKNKKAIPEPPLNQISHTYKSFCKYIGANGKPFEDSQLYSDVVNILLPKLRDILKVDSMELVEEKIEVKIPDAGYFNDVDRKVRVRFVSADFKGSSDWITIASLPSIDEGGILHHDRKEYSIINMLEQDRTISYNEKDLELKLKLSKGFITISYNKGGPKLSLSSLKSKSGRKAYSALFTMFAMAKEEGLDPEELFNEFRNQQISNLFTSDEKLQMGLFFYGGNKNSIEASEYDEWVMPLLRGTKVTMSTGDINDMYNISDIREELNELLSLDRAIGETLALDVESMTVPGKIVAYSGTVITSNDVERFKANGVYKLYIDNTPNLEGYYLAENIFIKLIPRGTYLIDELRTYLPEEKGMYVSKDYIFDNDNVIFLDNTVKLNQHLTRVLTQCGYTKLIVSMEKGASIYSTTKKVESLYFMKEIISNKFFLKDDVGVGIKSDSTWVMLNKDKEFVEADNYLTTYDLMAIISLSTELFMGNSTNRVSNVDAGFRKRLATVEEMYHRAFEFAVTEWSRKMNRSLKETWKENKLNFFIADEIDNKFYPLSKAFFKYLRDTSKSLQPLVGDVLTNPVSYASACTKVNVFLADKHSVTANQRQIAIGSCCRIDPYESPQSIKLGVVLNLATGCEVQEDGTMKTSYFLVKHIAGKTIVTNEKVSLTVREEEKKKIADISSFTLDDDGVVINEDDVVLCRVPSMTSLEKQSFAYVKVSEVDLVNYSSMQYLSWASGIIPFIGSNDAARVVFGVSQVKQAKGLLDTDIPRVMTYAHKYIPMLNDKFCIIAKRDGYISAIYSKNGVTDISYTYTDNPEDGIVYSFEEYSSNGYSVCIKRLEVEVGQTVKTGEVIVSSNFVKNGILAMGKEALVAYVPNGYNYEDGVNASQRICEAFTSYRTNTEKYEPLTRVAKINISSYKFNRWVSPDNDAAITLINTYKSGRSTKINFRTKKAKGFLQKAIIDIENKGRVKRYNGASIDLISIDSAISGDKFTNRHGNKGVMSQYSDNSTRLRFLNGEFIDIVYNPHGVTSRMNSGQIAECNLSFIGHIIDTHFCIGSFDSISKDEIAMLMEYTYDLANSEGDANKVTRQYPLIPDSFHTYCLSRINDIRFWKGCFDKEGQAYLINPNKGGKLTKTPVLVGAVEIQKLIQESDKKIHARAGLMSGEPYKLVSGAPTKGASEHGGQRLGTMEIDALSAYGASALIEECMNERGDNNVARCNMNSETYLSEDISDYYHLYGDGQRRSTTRFLYTMLALGVVLEADDREFHNLCSDNDNLSYYKTKALSTAYSKEEKESKENRRRKKEKESMINPNDNDDVSNRQEEYAKRMDEIYNTLKDLHL